ncbi:MAG: hypothetical protein AAF333_04500 [Planctomycetota bacterium]
MRFRSSPQDNQSIEDNRPPNLTGVEWNSGETPSSGPRPTPAAADDQESYLLYVGLIFGIALVLRILVVMMGPVFGIEQAYTPKTNHEIALAESLVSEQVFGLESQPAHTAPAAIDALRAERGDLPTAGETSLHPEFYEAPGYPAVLSIFVASGLPMTWLLVLQCVLGAMAVPLVFKVGMGVLGRKLPSVLASVIVALHPALLVSSATLAADTFVVLLMLGGLWGVAHAQRRNLLSAAGGGLALGCAALFAPILAWFAPVVGAWVVVTERRLCSVGLAAVLILGAALPVGGWVYRNAQHGLEPQVSAPLALDRLFGTAAAIENPVAGPYAPQTMQQLYGEFRDFARLPEHADTDTITLLDRYGRDRVGTNHAAHWNAIKSGAVRLGLDHSLDDAYSRLGIDYAPAGYAAQLLGEDVASAEPEEAATEWVINVWVGFNAALIAAMAVGAAVMLWRRRFAGLLLVFSTAGYFIYLSSAGADEAMRLPLIGLQSLLVMGVLAPASIRIKKPSARKLKKMRKLEDEDKAITTGSPLATAESLRPAPGSTDGPRLDPDATAYDDDDEKKNVSDPFGTLKDAVHPALRGGAASENEPTPEPAGGSLGGRPF